MYEQRPLKSEVLDIENLERVCLLALSNAFKTHEALGIEGLAEVKKNEYGDIALKGDIEAEEAVLEVMRGSGIPITIFSEEHGKVEPTENPKLLGTLDGIDGSGLYKKEFGVGRYGTMFSVYKGTDPSYKDYLFGGIMEHATKRLFFATKGKGAFVLSNGVKQPIHCSATVFFKKEATRIEPDENFDGAYHTTIITDTFLSKLQGFQRTRIDATSAHYADLASGACDLVLECTRKGNLELPVGYALVREAGGVIVDMQGEDLGPKKYLGFGQARYVPFIASATQGLANNLLKHLHAPRIGV